MKSLLVVGSFVLAIASIAAAYFCPSPFWQAVGINVGTSFMSLGVALLVVNVYLERSSRKGAVTSLLVLGHTAIADFHNFFLERCWSQFGMDEWSKAYGEYMKSEGDPSAVRQDVRDFLYDLAKSNAGMRTRVDRLSETLSELSRLVGWDLDPDLLRACLESRTAIYRLHDVEYDDSDKSKAAVTEHLLDADVHSQVARKLLMKIAGVVEGD
jgi:hypothetical protein